MDRRLRFAVIPTKDRPKDYFDCMSAIIPQVDGVVVVSHDAPYTYKSLEPEVVIPYHPDVPNISVMWNLGLAEASRLAGDAPYDVAVLNDDAIVAPTWFNMVSGMMHDKECKAASANQFTYQHRVFRKAGPISLGYRMAGFAFILDGTAGLYLDEQFQWWYGDDDLDWRAREAGGVALVGGVPVEHRHPSTTTVGKLADIAGDDRQRFINKWGRAPH